MTKDTVSIILLNHNGWEDTIECLESIYQLNYVSYNIIIVDNASQDESLVKIRHFCEDELGNNPNSFTNVALIFLEYEGEKYQNKIEAPTTEFGQIEEDSRLRIFLLKNDKNYGFAEGNNIGVRFALHHLNPDYLLFLNNDTVVDKHFLDILVNHCKENDKNAILGPTVYYYDLPQIISVFGGFINFYTGRTIYPQLDEPDEGQLAEESELDYISGCSLMIKRRVLEEIGSFNPHYFLYYEDTELCLRAKMRGHRVRHVSQAKVWHKDSPSSTSPTGVFYLTRNRFYFLRTYSTNVQFLTFLICFFIFYFWFHTLRHIIYYRDLHRLKAFYKGIIAGFKELPTDKPV